MSLIWELVEAIESTIDVNQQQGADAKQQMCRNTKTGQWIASRWDKYDTKAKKTENKSLTRKRQNQIKTQNQRQR